MTWRSSPTTGSRESSRSRAAIDDAVSAYRHLLQAGYDPKSIAFAGESAGGNLAAATILEARELGLPLPGAHVGFSPWFDLLGQFPSFDSGTDAFLVRPVSQLMAGMYLAGRDAHEPLANARFAYLAAKARSADVDVTVEVVPGMQHAFQWMAGRAPEADESITRAGDWLQQQLSD